ncbi:MAG: hypothetical protein IJ055_02830 [Oscillospiraceae bacterium]|nr:hypothetical protein [Oscillospiraceae bacterium]
MKDIFDYLEHAMDDELNEITDKTPELSDAQINHLFKMSERKYHKRKNAKAVIVAHKAAVNDDPEIRVQGVGTCPPPLWQRYAATAAACFIAVMGGTGIVLLMKHPPLQISLDDGSVDASYEMLATAATSALIDTGTFPAAAPDGIDSSTTAATGAGDITSLDTTAAVTAAEPSETSPIQEAEPQVTEPQSAAEETNTQTALPETSAGVYSSKYGIITLNADGTGTIAFQDTIPIQWNDHELVGADFTYPYTISGDTITVDVDGMDRSFTKGGELPQSDVNPIMGFVGRYAGEYPVDRASMVVEALGDNSAKVTISWGNSAWSTTEWTMSGACVLTEDRLNVSYQDSTCRNVEYNSDGEVVSDETAYTGGSGTLIFKGNTVEWDDDTEYADDMKLFTFIN